LGGGEEAGQDRGGDLVAGVGEEARRAVRMLSPRLGLRHLFVQTGTKPEEAGTGRAIGGARRAVVEGS
jgi:hypothetical protein